MLLFIEIHENMTYKRESVDNDGVESEIDCLIEANGDMINLQYVAQEAIRTYNKSKRFLPHLVKIDEETRITVYYHAGSTKPEHEYLVYEPKENGKKPSDNIVLKRGRDCPVRMLPGLNYPWFMSQLITDARMAEIKARRAIQKEARYTKGIGSH